MHDGLLAGQPPDQIFAGALPGLAGGNMNGGQARPQMPAPVEIVEADDGEVARHREAAALGFQQHAVGDDVVAADHRSRAVIEAEQIARRLARIVERVGHLDMPFFRQFDAALGKRAAEAGDAGAGAVVVALERGDDPDPDMSEFDDMRGGAVGRGLIVGADAGVGTVGPIDADIDEGHRIVGEQSCARRRDGNRRAAPGHRRRG